MPDTRIALASCGLAAAAGGALLLPLALVPGWQSAAAIGSQAWWLALTPAVAHHLLLLFGLIGIYAAIARSGASGLGAFIVASTGNALMLGVGTVQLTVLPALAQHPDGASALDCTPFYRAATASAAALIDRACAPWHFGALESWVLIGWFALLIGGLWLAVEIARRGGAWRPAGIGLAAGWLLVAASLAMPLPATVGRAGYLVVGLAYIGTGALVWRRRTPAGRD